MVELVAVVRVTDVLEVESTDDAEDVVETVDETYAGSDVVAFLVTELEDAIEKDELI